MKRTLIILLLLLIPGLSPAEEKLKAASLEWEPYIGSKALNEGYLAQVIREAFKEKDENTSVHIDYMAWAWVVSLAGSGGYDFYFPEYYSEKLKEKYLLSDPVPGGPLVFFKQRGKAISYTKLQDLKGHKIGTIRGYVNTKEFDEARYLNKEEAIQDIQNIRKLMAGALDLIVIDKYVGLHLIKTQMPDKISEIEVLSPPLENKDLFLCFPKDKEKAEFYQNSFNEGLAKLTKSGRLKEIMSIHGF